MTAPSKKKMLFPSLGHHPGVSGILKITAVLWVITISLRLLEFFGIHILLPVPDTYAALMLAPLAITGAHPFVCIYLLS